MSSISHRLYIFAIITNTLLSLTQIQTMEPCKNTEPQSELERHLQNFFSGKTKRKHKRLQKKQQKLTEVQKKLARQAQRIKIIRRIDLQLIQAAQCHNKQQALHNAKLALANGANINVLDKKGLTPLTHAGLTHPNIQLIHFLLEHGADPSAGHTFYRFALAGFPQLIEPFILYVPNSYINTLDTQIEVDNAAREFAHKKIALLKALCSAKINGKTIPQAIRTIESKNTQHEKVAHMLEDLEQHRSAIVAAFKCRLLR